MRLRRVVVLALLAALASTGPAGAGPAQLPVGTGGAATPNITPLAHVSTLGSGVGGAFLDSSTYVLSFMDAVWNQTFLPSTATGGLAVFDTSNPEVPRLQGMLPLPNYQNEDVSVSSRRRFAVMSQDRSYVGPQVPGRLHLIDLSQPTRPRVTAVLPLPPRFGHTATLVDGDRYLWVSGGEEVLVVDVRDLAAPRLVGTFSSPAGQRTKDKTFGLHDADVDRFGDITLYGSGGTAVHRLGRDPLRPVLVARSAPGHEGLTRFGHHGGKRLDRDTWLISEEAGSSCSDDGSFQVWRLDRRARLLRPLSSWDAPTGAERGRGALATSYCSSHWFDVNDAKVVADAWYGAGVRFLDLSDPRRPRPIGTWIGDSTAAGQALFAPGRPDVVYVADYVRGLDVLRIEAGGRAARTVTPADEKRTGDSAGTVPGLRFPVKLVPDRRWGWSCAVPEPLHHG